MTYGGIAALIPAPDAMPLASYRRVRARWVGYSMRACPEGLPWHRVVNAEGRISPRVGHGPHVQRILLEEEGVTFDEEGRIDLDRHKWYPSVQWSLDRDLLPPAKAEGGP
jgi:methylated-DNA-protein-cysteine methyltransferase-like protein